MKNYLLVFILLFFALTGFAQARDAVYNKMSAELCKEIKAKQEELKKSEDIQVDIGLLMMPIFMKYEDDLKKADPKFDMTDQKQVEALGYEIGKKLAACPQFMSLASVQKELVKEMRSQGEITMEGILVSVITGEFSCIQVKTSTGKVEKIWWMEYFTGEEKLRNGGLTNKPIKISYTEKEVYNATIKDYIKIKVATGIE